MEFTAWRNVTVSGCYIANNTAESNLGGGGGVLISKNCAIRDCTIEKNSAYWGGGVFVDIGGSECSVLGSRIEDNYATSYGGGVADLAENTFFQGCRIMRNRAARGGGGVRTRYESLFEECLVLENVCMGDGGGIHGSAFLDRCMVSRNRAGGSGGGCLLLEGVQRGLRNCIIAENEAEELGGGVCVFHPKDGPTVLNCTFSDNKAPVGSTVYVTGATGELRNCIFAEGGDERDLGWGVQRHFNIVQCRGGIQVKET